MFESPYPIVENPDGTYSFLSDYGIHYSIALFDASFHFNNISIPQGNIVEFSFGADKELPIDPKVTDTILQFLFDFFQNVLLYVCESVDRKQLPRKRVFDRWFLKYSHKDLEKYDFSFSLDDVIITGAVIIDVKNTERDVLLNAFLESYQVYSDYKS
ncbi:DUF6169 family protein [Runella zeae]|uniref:DUF6169 family protein n=1 Tax=Runella zeae TaxID=94255 RepID=UPI00040E4519|nr:DUF6169 family protein [Runella zeae]